MKSKPRREYSQTARADAVRRNRQRILRGARDLFFTRYFEDVTLQGIADRAGVTVQTILRHFGSKEGLLEAMLADVDEQVIEMHRADAVGDVQGALYSILERYEAMGDGVTMILAQEATVEPFAKLARKGRDSHRAWLEKIFEPHLPAAGDPLRQRRIQQLLLIFDVYTWKLLRRDHGMDREEVHQALAELLDLLFPNIGATPS